MKKNVVFEALTRKAMDFMSNLKDDEKLALVPETPISKLGSRSYEARLIAKIKDDTQFDSEEAE